MRLPQGFLIETPIDGSYESTRDTITCGHCEYVATVPPGCEPAHQCRGCMRFLCKICYAKRSLGGACIPFAKKLDLYEKNPGRYILR